MVNLNPWNDKTRINSIGDSLGKGHHLSTPNGRVEYNNNLA